MRVFGRFGRLTVAVATATATVSLSAVAASGHPRAAHAPTTTSIAFGCGLGNGVSHVVQITFDNVHFFRDNPNVPSDLELMPHLLNFIEHNGTMLSNNHTPLIAHTATDSLTNYTGLYGDRHGMPVSNSFKTFNPDGTTDPGVSFTYWTAPIFDPATSPNPGHDTNPSMVYSPVPPAFAKPPVAPNTITPAPWVPYTRAGCNVGDVSTANMVLENTGVDIPTVFGPSSPENAQLVADHSRFKDAEAADYVGVGVHCAAGAAFCATATGTKFGQTMPSATAVADILPTEPGGYHGYQMVMGHRYLAPQLGAGTPNVFHLGYRVTDGNGNLVDLAGNTINAPFIHAPGFPGFGDISASQSLAYVADLQESGVPVTFGYVSDLHGNHFYPNTPSCDNAPDALPPGDPCYLAQAQLFDTAFNTFFQRLAAGGINPSNTLFVFTADEGDHVAGANVGRAVTPVPPSCDGVTVACTYPAATFGELSTNVTGLLASQKHNTTPFTLHDDSAPQFYVTGQPGPTAPVVRQLERDVAGLTAPNPYSGNANEKVTNYLADPVGQGILHILNADPARTPTFTQFAKPDYFECVAAETRTCPQGPYVTVNNAFAYNHGDYAAEINTTWLGMAGPGVAHNRVDGLGAAHGPNSAGPNSGNVTVPASGTTGTWADHTDIRPTMLYLVGLKDDYIPDGRVITEDLTVVSPPLASPAVLALAQAYKQLNASVGLFGTATLIASTHALASTSPADYRYRVLEAQLSALGQRRDALANTIKAELTAAEFDGTPISLAAAVGQKIQAQTLIWLVQHLASL